ncbi:MAG: 50S ribosomal protein L29 [Bacteroidota bacterium]
MPSNKFLELQEFSDEELVAELKGLKAQYQSMQFDHATKGLDNPLRLREARRDIARIQTEVRRRQLSAMSEEQLAGRSKIRNRRRNK